MRISRLLSVMCGLLCLAAFPSCSSEDEDNHDPAAEGSDWDSSYDEVVSNACSGVRVPDTGNFKKKIAMTFDDGPNLATTPKVLDTLKAHNIKATFFINGRRVTSDEHKALLKRMVEEGHIVANHTQNHLNAATLSLSKFENEADSTSAIVETANKMVYFRFPFGSSTCATANAVKSRGHRITGWHVDSGDWCYANAKEPGFCPASTFKHVPDEFRRNMLGYVMSQVRSSNGGIVLFHDIHAHTADALDDVLTSFEKEGFSFTNVNDATVFPKLNGTTAAPEAGIGSDCTSDKQCSFDKGFCYGHTRDASGAVTKGYCSTKCEGLCPGDNTFCTLLPKSEPVAGFCAIKADPTDGCKSLPGTEAGDRQRFIGQSSAKAATASVCLGN